MLALAVAAAYAALAVVAVIAHARTNR